MNHKMNKYVQNIPAAEGETVQIVVGFGARTIDPQATRAVVDDLITATPEYAQVQSQQLKIDNQKKIAREAWALADKAYREDDRKNHAIHAASYKAALSAIAVLEDELRPLAAELQRAWDSLYMEHQQHFPCGPGQCCCEDGEYEDLKAKFDSLGEHQRLRSDGEIIPDWRGVEYWQRPSTKKGGSRWHKEKIEFAEVALPNNAVLADDLTPEMQAEIAEQQETDRIAAMSAEDKAKELEARLDALADEADRLGRRAEIRGREFDPVAYYNEKKEAIEIKYA